MSVGRQPDMILRYEQLNITYWHQQLCAEKCGMPQSSKLTKNFLIFYCCYIVFFFFLLFLHSKCLSSLRGPNQKYIRCWTWYNSLSHFNEPSHKLYGVKKIMILDAGAIFDSLHLHPRHFEPRQFIWLSLLMGPFSISTVLIDCNS